MADQPSIDGAVIERLERLGGKKLAIGMIDIFLEHAPTRVAAAQAALEAGDVDEIRRAAHSLKSSAGNLGATALQALCETMERTAGESRDSTELRALVARMVSECDAASRELTEIRKLYA